MREIELHNIKKDRYVIDKKGVVYDKRAFRGTKPVRKMKFNMVLLECNDKLYRVFSIDELVREIFTEEEVEKETNQSVYMYDRETGILLCEFESLDKLIEYFGYNKGQEARLNLICMGEKPQAKTGKLSNVVITYTKND